MRIVKNSNFPEKEVGVVVVSGEYSEVIERLNNIGIKTISTTACQSLPYGERFHADMQILHIDDRILILKESINLKEKLKDTKINIEETNINISNKYPFNVILNTVILEEFAILNINTVYHDVITYCKKLNKKIINVKQGYTKCSTAVINRNAVITSDNGIYKECTKHKIDVLKIREGYIDLPNYNYGFIGGCCSLIDKDKLVFTGDIKKHIDYDNIKSFCNNYSVDLISLSNKTLIDIGGIIPILYK